MMSNASNNDKNKNNTNNDNDGHSSDDDDEGAQIRILLKLSPDCYDKSLQVPFEAIAVPSSLHRHGLSTVVNHLLDRRIDDDEEEEEKKEEDSHDEDSASENEKANNHDDRLPSINFDFVLGKSNKLLRTAVEREARRTGLSLEEAIPITYFPAQSAPERQGESEPMPDWIAVMKLLLQKENDDNKANASSWQHVITGTYDGSLHVMQAQPQQQQKGTTPSSSTACLLKRVAIRQAVHEGPLTCLDVTSVASDFYVASGSMAQTLRVHKLSQKKQGDDDDVDMEAIVNCVGHSASLGSVDLLPATTTTGTPDNKLWMASGDWDGNLLIWQCPLHRQEDGVDNNENNDGQAPKKQKTGTSQAAQASKTTTLQELAPSFSIQAHGSKISGLSWGNYEKAQSSREASQLPHLMTASWDHSIKLWDANRQDCLLTLNGSRVVTCLDTSPHSSGIAVTGHPDCTLRLWDVRSANSTEKKTDETTTLAVSDNRFRPSHKAWITGVQWSQSNPYHVASTSHDGTVKLWDIRSALPLHTTRVCSKKEKSLCLAMGEMNFGNQEKRRFLFAGGSDCVVKQFQL